MRHVTSPDHYDLSSMVREMMAMYSEAEDLINIGAYVKGTNTKLDRAIAVHDFINRLLRQKVVEKSTVAETVAIMRSIVRGDS